MRAPTRLRYNGPKGTSTPPKTPRKRQSLIGNDMHSRARATALKCATFIFLIGNEFHLQRARKERPHARKTSMGHPANRNARLRRARAQQAAPLRRQSGKSPTLTSRAWGTRKGQISKPGAHVLLRGETLAAELGKDGRALRYLTASGGVNGRGFPAWSSEPVRPFVA